VRPGRGQGVLSARQGRLRSTGLAHQGVGARRFFLRCYRIPITHGIQESHFGYVSGPKPGLSADGKYEVSPSKVRFKIAVAEDEIDLDSGFLMLPQAIPQPAAPADPGPVVIGPGDGAEPPPGGGGGSQVPPGTTVPPVKPALDTAVELNFSADRNGLFTAWNAIANLADLAGKVALTVRAESAQGFDKAKLQNGKAKLQNGVMEPLREADLIE
jgi:hypothetical protein